MRKIFGNPVKLVETCLLRIGQQWVESDEIRVVNPAFVLCEAWNETRLQKCRVLSDKGSKPPLCRFVALQLDKMVLYVVDDGTHRTCVAEERGESVTARISGTYQCMPENFRIWQSKLWRVQENSRQRVVYEFISDLTEDMIAFYISIGVKHGS